MDVKLKHICSPGGERQFIWGSGWQTPVVGHGKNKKASNNSKGFGFSALYSSCLKIQKLGMIHKTLSFKGCKAARSRKWKEEGSGGS